MARMLHCDRRVAAACGFILSLVTPAAQAQTVPTPTFQAPTVIVNAQKEPADAQTLPVSVTAIRGQTLSNAGITVIREAAIYAPNTYFTDFTARKLSNPRFRGIGSSPNNPSITAYLDGVPQLNANSSSLDLIDVEQVEFVRGPQSALFGRNTLGGVINISSARPSLSDWRAAVSVPVSNFDARDLGASVSGPLASGRIGVGLSFKYGQRDGYTINTVTGRDLDSRKAFLGKAQLLWTPSATWETRVIVTGERARDGDYALSDLAGLRTDPFRTARDFEGHTDRDITATTVLVRRAGARVNLTTTTGLVRWKTVDATDLDYSPLPLARRDNSEKSLQFTQEVRLASAADAPVRLPASLPLRWQAGVFLFTQNYEQDAFNTLGPFVLSPFVPFAVEQHSPQSALDDFGVGVYGQGTVTVGNRVDLTAGARVDRETKDAKLMTFFSLPGIAPPTDLTAEKSFSNVSPQFSAVVRLQPGRMLYGSVGRGFKAGGFNAASPVGSEAYGVERTWNVEGGLKTTWAGGRVTANVAVFRIDWDDLQVDLPDPAVPAQFYVANVGGAASSGVEVEVNARAAPGVELFTAIGTTHARYKAGSVSSGVNIAGNTVQNTPDYTATFGTQVSHQWRPNATVYGRAEVALYGGFQYDSLNLAQQDRYSLTNLRAGVRSRGVFAEAWVRNAFDTHYVPVAFAFGALAPSGFLGESGAPRTFGVSAGVSF
jgi:iron complex outermembrane recepter protein